MSLFDPFTNQAQTQAANAQISGIQQGLSQALPYYTQGQAQLQQNYGAGLAPFQQNFQQAQPGIQQYQNLLGLGGPAGGQQALQALQNTPGYQFNLGQGLNAINAQNAATGQTGSGNAMLAAQKFGSGLASNTYQNAVQNAQPFLNQANQAASGIGNLYSGLGNQLNASSQGIGNMLYGGLSSIGNANANAALGNLTGASNLWGLGTGLLGLGANSVGGGLLNSAGSGLKTLFGQLSDIRAKDDIEEVGELKDGQKVYRFTYKGDDRPQIGLMAQEVEERIPEAVHEHGGLKFVDYRTATNRAAELSRFASAPEIRGLRYAAPLQRKMAA